MTNESPEDAIERSGRAERYIDALIAELDLFLVVLDGDDGIGINPLLPPETPYNAFDRTGAAFLWALLRATPEQKARAFEEAMR